MIEYWHWHTLHFGTETYWAGVLPHSGRPGRVYREIAALGQELREAGPLVSGLNPDADVALVLSMPTRWAMQRQPALGDRDARRTRAPIKGLIGDHVHVAGRYVLGSRPRRAKGCGGSGFRDVKNASRFCGPALRSRQDQRGLRPSALGWTHVEVDQAIAGEPAVAE
jgi:hypothetical protein